MTSAEGIATNSLANIATIIATTEIAAMTGSAIGTTGDTVIAAMTIITGVIATGTIATGTNRDAIITTTTGTTATVTATSTSRG